MDKEQDNRKPLLHSEIHFRGYWVQLQSRIRRNDDADDYLEGYLENPLVELRKAWNAHNANPRPAGDAINQLYNTGESVSSTYNFALCIKTLYTDTTYGDPSGSFPPTLKQLEEDPMKHFKFFIQATENGTKGGTNAQGRGDVAAKAWVKLAYENVKRCRKACKHIWDVALATFTSAKATTLISGLPYGAGPALLKQIESQQERQTTMALFTLFDQLISLRLGPKESFSSLFARATGIRARLKNWKPPIELPDQLLIVCLMRQLPRQFHGTRTIIMTTPTITLASCRDMLLDAENRDAERVKRELGTAGAATSDAHNEGTGLVGEGGDRNRNKKKKKKKKPAEKSAKYKSEGPCSLHGSRCSHASSECYTLHPELRRSRKKGEGDVAEAEVAEGSNEEAQPYGFMNEELGYCLMYCSDEKQDDTDDGDMLGERDAEDVNGVEPAVASAGYATPIIQTRTKKVYAVAVGHQTGIFLTYDAACRAYKGYPGAKFKGFKDMSKAKQYLMDNLPPTAEYAKSKITRRKPRNYGWSQKGTKATRRAAKAFPASKNVIEAEVLQCKRGKPSGNEDNKGVKRLARTGGIKNLSQPELIDLTGESMDQDAESQLKPNPGLDKDVTASKYKDVTTPIDKDVMASKYKDVTASTDKDVTAATSKYKDVTASTDKDVTATIHQDVTASRYKDVTSASREDVNSSVYKDVTSPAEKTVTELTDMSRAEGIGVRLTRSFAPGLKTTMVHRGRVSRNAVSEGTTTAERDNTADDDNGVTFEVKMTMETLRKLLPGATVKLEVADVRSRTGEALLASSSGEVPEDSGLYNFMNEYDADDEDDAEEDLCDHEATQLPPLIPYCDDDDELIDDLSDDDSSSDSEPENDEPGGVSVSKHHSLCSNAKDDSDSEPGELTEHSNDSSDTYSSDEDYTDEDGEPVMPEADLITEERCEPERDKQAEPGELTEHSNDSSDTYSSDEDYTDEDGEPVMPEADLITEERCEPECDKQETGEALVNSLTNERDNTALDSGATEHCAKLIKGELDAASVNSMSGLNGTRTPVKGMARVRHVQNVMYTPGISRNLLSVGRLLDQHGGSISFTRDKAHLVTKKKNVLVAQRAQSGLYIVCNRDYDLSSATGDALAATSIPVHVARERVIALHKAFGHASLSTLRAIVKKHNFSGVTTEHLKLLPPCEACLLGKAHKAAKRRQASEKATRFGERLCADCCGPFRTKSIGGCSYLLIVICEHSAWTWVFPVASLTQVVNHLKTLLEVDLHQRDDRSVKYFRSDGGTEFKNKKVDELLAKFGIVRETTCANTSYQNGKAERRIRTLFDRVRTTLSDATLYVSRGFWADSAAYAAYTLNRTPSEDSKSPFELRYGRPPKVSHLRPFGNPCVIYRKRSVAGKIEDAGVKGTFLGYGYVSGKRGYRVRIDGTNSVVTTRDVSFCAFKSRVEPVQILPGESSATPDAVITEPANAAEIDARHNTAVREETTDVTPNSNERQVSTTITIPENAKEAEKAIAKGNFTYLTGAKVDANWKGRGIYYPAVVTEVHAAGSNGSRNTYDLVYECDGEAERNVSGLDIRPRNGDANIAMNEPCGHALITDCHPAYLADVPDLARTHVTPKHYGQAIKCNDKDKWTASMQDELGSLKKQGVYAFVNELPTGKKALRCLWVYKVKCGADGEVTRYKSRLTVNGKSQRYGIDYKKTFSPVAFATSIRLLFALGISNKFKFHQYDIKCAFLYADLPKQQQVYMHAPPGSGRKGFWLLKKSLYGLKQAPMLFNGHLDDSLKSMGFASCTFDPCLYLHKSSGAYLVVVVDDMVLASPTVDFSTTFFKELSQKYDVKDLGQPSYVIGVRVHISPHSVKFTQDRYISDLRDLHKPGDKPTNTPATPNDILCAAGLHKRDESPLLSDPAEYRSLVGGLMYTLITRPDVATAVSTCARYVKTPRQAHMNAAKRILRFLYHTRERSLVYATSDSKSIIIKAFVDSSWANDIDTRRSRFGYAIYVGKCLVAWCSKLHPALAMSSAEAEYTAATEVTKTIKWIVSLISFLGTPPLTPVEVYEDNDACRIMASTTQVSGRNKHFDLRQHFVRNQVNAGLIKLLPIRTKHQIADIMTKPTARPTFEKHAAALLDGLPNDFHGGPTVEGGC